MQTEIVAILSDFGLNNPYVAEMKGVLLSGKPNLTIVDITHQVPRHNILIASFFLRAVESYFPKGTFFLAVVDPGVGTNRRAMALEREGKTFIGPDNGIFTPFIKKPFKAFKLPIPQDASPTFHGRDVFALHLRKLILGERLEDIGIPIYDPVKLDFPIPKKEGKEIKGEILFSDPFGNLITNIPSSMLSKRDVVSVKFMGRKLHLFPTYGAAKIGEPLALIGSFGNLEITVREGDAKEFFSATEGEEVIVSLKK